MRTAAACIGVMLSTAVILAQQAEFRSGTELVTIDVVATDADGRPVKNLVAADFEIFEDDAAQTIQAFQFIDTTSVASTPALPAGVSGNQQEPGALFAVVIDELGLPMTDTRDVRRTLERFFQAALRANDYVAVVRSGANSGFLLTSDRQHALEMIAQTAGRQERALGLEQAGDALTGAPAGDLADLAPGSSARGSFDVLLAVVERFRPIVARRKAVIWVSRGGDLAFRTFDDYAAGRAEARDEDRLTRLMHAARTANVAIYTVDPRGLVAPSTEGAGAPVPSALPAVDTLRDLATATGGRPIVNANDLNGGLMRIAEENRAYYLLGYRPPAGRSERVRRLHVRTRRAGVALLHRSMYAPASSKPAVSLSLLESPLPVPGLPILLAPAVAAVSGNRRGLVVPFEIGVDLPAGAQVNYTVMAFAANGREAARATGRVTSIGGRALGSARLALAPATYQIRVAASVAGSAAQGLAMVTMRVPRGKSERATCAGFAFEQPGGETSLRVFTRDQPLTMTTIVSAPTEPGPALSFGLGTANQPPERHWPVTGRKVADGLWQFTFMLKPPLPRGVADITLLQKDLMVGEGCRATFRVE
jgi:VWFA-related protein